jgi:rRNA maturation protein Rpf1
MDLIAAQKNKIVDKVDKFIENFSIDELIIVNKIVVEKIKHLQKASALFEMAKFRIGDVVSFRNDKRLITGTIYKFNQKTITIITEDEGEWNVSPRILMKRI